MSAIPVFFTFDNNYVVPALVAFNSFCESVDISKGNVYEFIVCHSDITEANQRGMEKLISQYAFCSLRFLNVRGFLTNEWESGCFSSVYTGQFCKETLYRCFAANLLPEYDKIIYSDVDVIFKKDISDLLEIDLGSNYVGGVKLVQYERRDDELAHLEEPYFSMLKDTYIAGGIWVMNLKKIREDSLETRMIEVVEDDSIKKVWNDQDVINIACAGKVAHIPLRYISYADIKFMLDRDGAVLNYSKEDVYELFFDPTIIHYTGLKPWRLKSARLMEWWVEYGKIKQYCTDFGCYRVKWKRKILFAIYHYIYCKLKLKV